MDDHWDEMHTEINDLGFQCEICDFYGKTKAGLQAHMRAKHKKIDLNSTTTIHSKLSSVAEPDIVIVEQTSEHLENEIESVVQEEPIEYGEFYCSRESTQIISHNIQKSVNFVKKFSKTEKN